MPSQPDALLAPNLLDPTGVAVRRLSAADAEHVAALYAELSSRARFLRFGAGTPPPTGALLARLVDLDGASRVAWGAFAADGALVGEGRLERVRHGVVEAAVVVAEAWRRRGLGRCLLHTAATGAAQRGEHSLLVAVHPENRAAAALVRQVLGVVLADRGGLLEGIVALAGTPARVPIDRKPLACGG